MGQLGIIRKYYLDPFRWLRPQKKDSVSGAAVKNAINYHVRHGKGRKDFSINLLIFSALPLSSFVEFNADHESKFVLTSTLFFCVPNDLSSRFA